MRELRSDPTTHLTVGRTLDNADNLASSFLQTILARYQGTRLGRQELDPELLEDVPGAARKRTWIDDYRLGTGCELPAFRRVVVGS